MVLGFMVRGLGSKFIGASIEESKTTNKGNYDSSGSKSINPAQLWSEPRSENLHGRSFEEGFYCSGLQIAAFTNLG